MQNDPESRRSPSRFRTPSDSPVRIDSSMVSPREETDDAVRDELVAGLDPHDVAGDDLVARVSSTYCAVPDHVRLRGDEQRELVERLLRLQLLADPDRRVDHRDQPEQGVGEQPQREHDHEEDGEDRVEEREDVAGDDARHRAARRRLGESQPLAGAPLPRRCSGPALVRRLPRAPSIPEHSAYRAPCTVTSPPPRE